MKLSLALVLLVSCGPSTPAILVQEDDSIARSCDRLRELRCPEGQPNAKGKTCAESLASAARVASVPTDCLISATTKDQIRECGGGSDVRVRCRD